LVIESTGIVWLSAVFATISESSLIRMHEISEIRFPFDKVICHVVLHDINDVAHNTTATIVRVLRFIASSSISQRSH
jgi:hypothetical protein